MSLLNPDPSPQFSTAEYAGQSDRCKQCGNPIMGSYYRSGAKIVCPSCAELLKREGPQDSHSTFMRGLLFGIGGAILGLILYSGFTIVTGLYIGYISLAVGFIVAKAIMLGSRGIGGRKYQIAAVLLTYAAVSLSAIPISIHYLIKEKAAQAESGPSSRQSTQPASDNTSSANPQQGSDNTPSGNSQQPQPKSLAAVIGYLLLMGLASPFLDLQNPAHGLIGLVILAVGIRIAWKMAEGSADAGIYGPFENSKSASA